MIEQKRRFNYSLSVTAMVAGLFIAMAGLLILQGWRYDLDNLKSLWFGQLDAKANSGAFYLFSGLALVLVTQKRWGIQLIATLFSFLATSIGALTLVEYIFSTNLGIDDLFLRNIFLIQPYVESIRMPLNEALSQLMTGTALFYLTLKNTRFTYLLQFFIVFTISINLLSLLSIFFGISIFSSSLAYSDMAPATSVLFILLCSVMYFIYLTKYSYQTSVELKFFAGKILAIALIVFFTLLFNSVINTQTLINFKVKKSQETAIALNQMLSYTLDYDSDMRDFLLSSDSLKIRNAETIKRSMQDLIPELQSMVANNPEQTARVDTLAHLVKKKIEFVDTIKSLIEAHGWEFALGIIASNSGRDLTPRIKQQLYQIKAIEQEQLNRRMDAELDNNRKILRLIFLNLFIQLTLITGIFFLIHRNNSHLAAAMEKIRGMNNKLESKVKERTSMLSKSEELFRTTIETMTEGCQIINFDWKYLYINDAAEKQNRCSKESLLDNIYMEMWPGVENTEVFRKMKICMDNRILQKFEHEFVFPDGSTGWYDLKIMPVPEGIFIFSTDITELKRIQKEEQLATEILKHLNQHTNSEQMLNSIVNAIKKQMDIELVGIRLKESEIISTLRTFGFNEQQREYMEHLCFFSKDDKTMLVNNNGKHTKCLCADILDEKIDYAQPYFTPGGSFWLNQNSQRNNQKYLVPENTNCKSFNYESIALVPLKSGNHIVGLLHLLDSRSQVFTKENVTFLESLGTSIGIALMRNRAETELKKLNADLELRIEQRTQKLLESNKELESFAYSVSHDLRAPLRHVIGFSEKLEKHLAEKEDPEVLRLTGKISSSASRMGNLIDELLTYSRLGKTDLNFQTIASSTIVDAVIAETDGLTGETPVEWKIGNLPRVFADKTSLQLVFQNLINNALKFSGKNDKIEIEIGCDEINKKEYRFFVKDNGVGFNMDYYNNLFGVFQRLHSANEYEGTGIGLASVRRIINRHNGRVWAESKENIGATFYFTLPKNLNTTDKNIKSKP